MAKQIGIIKLDSTMADITFYRTKHGYMAKEKQRIPPGRILNDPRFARTRENMAEFGRACNAAKVLKNAMGKLLTSFAGKSLQNRLTQEMMKVIHLDMVNPRGLRNVIDGEAELIEGFDFNSTSPLETGFNAPLSLTLDRVTGDANISIDPLGHQLLEVSRLEPPATAGLFAVGIKYLTRWRGFVIRALAFGIHNVEPFDTSSCSCPKYPIFPTSLIPYVEPFNIKWLTAKTCPYN